MSYSYHNISDVLLVLPGTKHSALWLRGCVLCANWASCVLTASNCLMSHSHVRKRDPNVASLVGRLKTVLSSDSLNLISPENTCSKSEVFYLSSQKQKCWAKLTMWLMRRSGWSTCTVTLMKFNILCYRLLLLLPCQHWISFVLMSDYLCVEVPHGADRLHWPSIITAWLHLVLYIFRYLIQTLVFILKSHQF